MEECETPRVKRLPNFNSRSPRKYDALSQLPKLPKNRSVSPLLISKHIRDSSRELQTHVQNFQITCINCQELINVNSIESHSKECIKVTENVASIDSSSFLQQTTFKLEKLEKCLEDIIATRNLRPGDKNYLSVLIKFCNKIVKFDYNEFEACEAIVKNLENLLISHQGSSSLKIYADKLYSISKDMLEAIRELAIQKKKQEIDKMRFEVKLYKDQAEMLQNKINKRVPGLKIADISKPLKTVESEINLRNLNTPTTSNSATEEASPLLEEHSEENLSDKSDLQRYFYALCLGYKLKLSKNSESRYVSIQKLYSSAISSAVPAEKWKDWIAHELSSPEKWFGDKPKSSRRSRMRTETSRRAKDFEAIIEESSIDLY
ncbi:unnamed protein product [Blepharisma stoltei]|uniref:UBZ4-type domain-containing protein n=1 Tax=Blepharisma stoltei TaxID=1481888 RepID=A0AAU9J1B5_9CILI|nr:unnamed protein product [Blepharisma stoltei]